MKPTEEYPRAVPVVHGGRYANLCHICRTTVWSEVDWIRPVEAVVCGDESCQKRMASLKDVSKHYPARASWGRIGDADFAEL